MVHVLRSPSLWSTCCGHRHCGPRAAVTVTHCGPRAAVTVNAESCAASFNFADQPPPPPTRATRQAVPSSLLYSGALQSDTYTRWNMLPVHGYFFQHSIRSIDPSVLVVKHHQFLWSGFLPAHRALRFGGAPPAAARAKADSV